MRTNPFPSMKFLILFVVLFAIGQNCSSKNDGPLVIGSGGTTNGGGWRQPPDNNGSTTFPGTTTTAQVTCTTLASPSTLNYKAGIDNVTFGVAVSNYAQSTAGYRGCLIVTKSPDGVQPYQPYDDCSSTSGMNFNSLVTGILPADSAGFYKLYSVVYTPANVNICQNAPVINVAITGSSAQYSPSFTTNGANNIFQKVGDTSTGHLTISNGPPSASITWSCSHEGAAAACPFASGTSSNLDGSGNWSADTKAFAYGDGGTWAISALLTTGSTKASASVTFKILEVRMQSPGATFSISQKQNPIYQIVGGPPNQPIFWSSWKLDSNGSWATTGEVLAGYTDSNGNVIQLDGNGSITLPSDITGGYTTGTWKKQVYVGDPNATMLTSDVVFSVVQ